MNRRFIGSVARCAAALGLFALVSATPVAAQPSTCEFTGVERIVAIGDVHGAYDRFVEILQVTGLIDTNLHWSGGMAHLVQLGDVDDRGPDSRKALDLLRRLVDEAPKAGGQVHALLGNHEVMRLLGDLRYVTPGEYESFVTSDSERIRKNFVSREIPGAPDEVINKTPLGSIELRVAFGPDGDYGQWLRTLNTVVRINGIDFLHGGISPAIAEMSCDAINQAVIRELTSDLTKTLADAPHSVAAGEDGPLWYRGLAHEPDTFEPQVAGILEKQKARAMVIAHTVTPSGRILPRFNGKVYQLDTGMQPAYVKGGRASALEIRGDKVTAIYTDRRDVLPDLAAP